MSLVPVDELLQQARAAHRVGEDGVAGLEQLHAAGGHVIAQSEESCVVPDMPKTAVKRGIVDRVLAPGEIASAILQLDGQHKSNVG